MKTAVVYARYSSNNQTEQSILGQKHICEDYAKRNDIIIVDYYIDRAMTGTNDDRDAFQKMLKDSNNKKWDYVLVYKLDRFARNKYESAIHRKHLKDNGITLLSAMENIPETPEGVLLESLIEGMNEYFSKELAQKVARGQHESRMKGYCLGRVPYGYTKENKLLSINPDEANIIKRMFGDYSSGKTILQISRTLEQESITNKGSKFSQANIRSILRNERYTGICKTERYVYDKIYPQIITPELFKEVNEKLDVNKYGCRKPQHEKFRLRNKVYCGSCAKKMYPISTISHNGNTLRYYLCTATKKRGCKTSKIEKNFLEKVVDRFLINEMHNNINLNCIIDKVLEAYNNLANNNSSLISLKNDLKNTKNSILNIMSAIEKGIYTETTKSRLEELEHTQNELQEKLVIEESKQQFELTRKDIEDYFKKCLKQCPDNAIEFFINRINVFEDKIEIYINYPLNRTFIQGLTKTKLFTENLITERICKGGVIHTKSKPYDVYLVY